MTKHFSVKNGPLRWGMLVEKQKHCEQGLAVTSYKFKNMNNKHRCASQYILLFY